MSFPYIFCLCRIINYCSPLGYYSERRIGFSVYLIFRVYYIFTLYLLSKKILYMHFYCIVIFTCQGSVLHKTRAIFYCNFLSISEKRSISINFASLLFGNFALNRFLRFTFKRLPCGCLPFLFLNALR